MGFFMGQGKQPLRTYGTYCEWKFWGLAQYGLDSRTYLACTCIIIFDAPHTRVDGEVLDDAWSRLKAELG